MNGTNNSSEDKRSFGSRLRQWTDIHSLYGFFIKRYRPQRMNFLAGHFSLTEDTNVLDVGGSMTNWNLLPFQPRLTLLNIGDRPADLPSGVNYVRGDACDMSFDDNEFDLVFSNSVIEHVGSWENQRKMASEVWRVGRSHYVQTPNYCFPIEPHLLTPFIHWLPNSIQKLLIRNFTVWGWYTRPQKEECDSFVDSTRLLSKRELQSLFPSAELISEKWLFMSKSFIAIHRDQSPTEAAPSNNAEV